MLLFRQIIVVYYKVLSTRRALTSSLPIQQSTNSKSRVADVNIILSRKNISNLYILHFRHSLPSTNDYIIIFHIHNLLILNCSLQTRLLLSKHVLWNLSLLETAAICLVQKQHPGRTRTGSAKVTTVRWV